MYNVFLDANADGLQQLTTAGEKLSTGLTVMLLGLATVFSVLAILWVVLLLFRVVFYREKKPEPAKETAAAQPVAETVSEPEPAPEEKSDDGALIAAITAAITAYRASSGEGALASGFRVVSFRRAEHASPWNKSK